MTRITPIDPDTATGRAKELLDAVQRTLGMTPNMIRTMARNPAVLEAWIALRGALGKTLTRDKRADRDRGRRGERVHLLPLGAHRVRTHGRVDEHELALCRDRESSDPKVAAALQFACAVNAKRGAVGDDDLARVRAAGWDDGQIAAIVAHVGMNVFTNYFNLVCRPVVDFPEIRPGIPVAA